MAKRLDHKYYLIMGDSVLDLLRRVNDQNIRTINTYRTTACIQQVIEPRTAPGEYFAICYDVDLPPLQTETIPDDEPF